MITAKEALRQLVEGVDKYLDGGDTLDMESAADVARQALDQPIIMSVLTPPVVVHMDTVMEWLNRGGKLDDAIARGERIIAVELWEAAREVAFTIGPEL